ncbi:MAG: sulfite exporter TauE/SafE family protein, partial [Solirubrobacteraceae bacterium]
SEAGRRERAHLRMATRHKVAAVVLGFTIGVVLGVTSAGSGTLIAVGLIVGFRLTPHLVVGTDVVHAALLLWVASAAHLVSGNVDLALAGTILLGSVPGVWIGTNLSTRLPADALRPALAIVLIASGLALLSKAGLALPVAVLAGVPVALAVLTFLVHRSRRLMEV